MKPDDLLCSRNARPEKALVGCAQERRPDLIWAGCSKRPSSKAAGESKPETYPLGYVEDFDEPRTKLAGFFSSRLSGETGSLPIDDPHSCENQCDAEDFADAHRFVQQHRR
jgi:hypothetical protein